jgi:hypothetical protein
LRSSEITKISLKRWIESRTRESGRNPLQKQTINPANELFDSRCGTQGAPSPAKDKNTYRSPFEFQRRPFLTVENVNALAQNNERRLLPARVGEMNGN